MSFVTLVSVFPAPVPSYVIPIAFPVLIIFPELTTEPLYVVVPTVYPDAISPLENIPTEFDPKFIIPSFSILESVVPYRAAEPSPTLIVPVGLFAISANLPYIAVEFAPDKLILPLLIN